ncbi:MAG TPA: hypothetical protein VD994_10555 [Prosthecobacter sp.]|nr:hypothetical protein [Prosthecobacter sp.]
MASDSNVIRLQVSDYRRRNVTDLRGGVVLPFAKHLPSLPSRYKPYARQGQELNTEITTVYDFWVAVARTWERHVASFDVLHVHQHERGAAQCHTEKPPAEFAVPTARKLQPDEPA